MKILLSPAKKMKMTDACPVSQQHLSEPPLHAQALEIARLLKECTLPELGKVLGASGATLQHAATLYHQFATGMQPDQAALFAYTGTAYTALNPISLSSDTLQFAQDHLRILSGLYGILRPFDRIEEYRLDVGNKLKIDEYKNLYDFWRDPVYSFLEQEKENELIFNLASEEYFKMIDPRLRASAKVITPVFKEFKGAQLRSVSPKVKAARGKMTRFILENRIIEPEMIKEFAEGGYLYSPEHSSDTEFVFIL